ncbi:MAG: hypothetical protein U0234_32200 [Sandaracinus sp.]
MASRTQSQWISLVLAAGLVAFAGCQRAHVTEIDAARPPTDSGPPPDLDSDGDGLCDVTESFYRTDPFAADTDDDGFGDFAEVQNASDPLSLSSPDRRRVHYLSQDPTGMTTVPIAFSIRGIGETFTGELVRVPVRMVDDGTLAPMFYAGSRAVDANPMDNVRGGIVDTSFRGVIGRTRLVYQVSFRQTQPARGCLSAYPFQYVTKTGEGTYRGSFSGWLVLAPSGVQVGSPGATWCGPVSRSCL